MVLEVLAALHRLLTTPAAAGTAEAADAVTALGGCVTHTQWCTHIAHTRPRRCCSAGYCFQKTLCNGQSRWMLGLERLLEIRPRGQIYYLAGADNFSVADVRGPFSTPPPHPLCHPTRCYRLLCNPSLNRGALRFRWRFTWPWKPTGEVPLSKQNSQKNVHLECCRIDCAAVAAGGCSMTGRMMAR